jgi:hypothetical protein
MKLVAISERNIGVEYDWIDIEYQDANQRGADESQHVKIFAPSRPLNHD